MNSTLDIKYHSFTISINDLKDKYYDGIQLTSEEFKALQNYDTYRLRYLNEAASEKEFDERYMELQAKANLAPYDEFLDLNKLS